MLLRIYIRGKNSGGFRGNWHWDCFFHPRALSECVCVCVTLPPGRRRRRGAAIRSHSKGMKGERRRKGEEEQEYGGGNWGMSGFGERQRGR